MDKSPISRYAPPTKKLAIFAKSTHEFRVCNLLFETYKLHAELAERAAVLREDINKLYTGMVTAIVAATVLLERFGVDGSTQLLMPALGVLVSFCWMLSLHSSTGRLAAKQKVLVALEDQLPFAFLKQENEEYEQSSYLRRKRTAWFMPTVFLLFCIGWLAASYDPEPALPTQQVQLP